MVKKLGLPLFLIFFLLLTIPSFYLISSQSITISEKKVVYDLPFPGLLPDHPLYFFKNMRDKTLDFTTRDHLKKAELYLLMSDKHINAATLLVKKGKNTMAVESLQKGEEYALKIPKLVNSAKKQGQSPTTQFLEKLRLSNTKHREVIEQLLKSIPQGEQAQIENVFKLNEKVKHDIEGL